MLSPSPSPPPPPPSFPFFPGRLGSSAALRRFWAELGAPSFWGAGIHTSLFGLRLVHARPTVALSALFSLHDRYVTSSAWARGFSTEPSDIRSITRCQADARALRVGELFALLSIRHH